MYRSQNRTGKTCTHHWSFDSRGRFGTNFLRPPKNGQRKFLLVMSRAQGTGVGGFRNLAVAGRG